MKNILLKINLVLAGIFFTTAFNVNAQTPVIDEDFTLWTEQGYGPRTPSGGGGGSCEATDILQGSYTVNKVYTGGTVVYTLDNAGVSPTCGVKGGTSPSCTVDTDLGYIQLANTGGTTTDATNGKLTTSALDVTTVDLLLSATGGAPRDAYLLKSSDGGANWDTIQHLVLTCPQYGAAFNNIAVNANNILLRVVVDLATGQRIRIHKLKVYGSIISGTKAASWESSGISVISQEHNLLFKSDRYSGSVNIVDLTGSVVAKKDIHKGSEELITVPNGLYIVRFISEDKVYTKKVFVN